MKREDMNEIKDNVSDFVLGLFSLSSLILKIISVVQSFKGKGKNEENQKLVEKENFRK